LKRKKLGPSLGKLGPSQGRHSWGTTEVTRSRLRSEVEVHSHLRELLAASGTGTWPGGGRVVFAVGSPPAGRRGRAAYHYPSRGGAVRLVIYSRPGLRLGPSPHCRSPKLRGNGGRDGLTGRFSEGIILSRCYLMLRHGSSWRLQCSRSCCVCDQEAGCYSRLPTRTDLRPNTGFNIIRKALQILFSPHRARNLSPITTPE
jgi:hypothetical protein